MPNLIENAQLLARATREAAGELGLEVFAKRPGSSVTAIKAPAGMDSKVIVKGFKERFGAIIANGQGSMQGQIFRMAHLGYFDFADMFGIIAGLELILRANGHKVELGKGVAAVQRVYEEAEGKRIMNVLIAEPMAQAGIELFQAQPGWNVIVSNPKEFAKHLRRRRGIDRPQRRAGYAGNSETGSEPASDRARGRRRR